jgi:RNA polymerase sigma factor (TIGR02999 family)
MSEVSRILDALQQGDARAADQLLPLVYDELRRLAAQLLAREGPGQTLTATGLVHEAYLRLVGADPAQPWQGRGHFFAAAARAMRRILIDNARRKQARKHGGGGRRVDLEEACPVAPTPAEDLLALDEALSRFAQQEPLKAALVELRYFGGLSVQKAAQTLGISLATAERHWTFARTWLYAEILGGPQPSGE